jgi:AraC family transcriptional regulator of adaptative response/methylated-DNA-[protein]-cysteine methyltransferase
MAMERTSPVACICESDKTLLGTLGVVAAPSCGSDSLLVSCIPSPLGPLLAGATAKGLCLLEFSDQARLEKQLKTVRHLFGLPTTFGTNVHLDRIKDELDLYFAGDLMDFSVPLERSGTEFQEKVWDELLRIPYGETRSYQDLADALGSPGAVRAVGHANGQNRLAIVVPCHRVINKSGGLGGYGGGLPNKRRLLDLEQSHRPKPLGGLFAAPD